MLFHVVPDSHPATPPVHPHLDCQQAEPVQNESEPRSDAQDIEETVEERESRGHPRKGGEQGQDDDQIEPPEDPGPAVEDGAIS